MTIEITATKATAYGEQLMLNVLVDGEDGRQQTVALGMSAIDGRQWRYVFVDVDIRHTPHLDFFFTVMEAGNAGMREQSPVLHRLDLSMLQCGNVVMHARWNDVEPCHMRYYTTAFSECLEPHRRQRPVAKTWARTLRIVARAPQLRSGERLVLAMAQGDAEPDASRVQVMAEHSVCEWQADLNADMLGGELNFRLAAQDADGGIMWEAERGRRVVVPQMQRGDMTVYEVEPAWFDVPCRTLQSRQVSMLSLDSGATCGVADFGSLADYVESAHADGVDMLCLHPLSDTTATHTAADATPYSSVSVFALHPLFLDVRQLPAIADPSERESMQETSRRLSGNAFDYVAAVELKRRWLHAVFLQEGDHAMHSAAFRHFFAANERWLVPYAQYSYLRDAYATPDFRTWPNHREWTEAERGQLQNSRTKAYKKLAFIYYTQFVLSQQLQRVHERARAAGLVMQCDLTANLNPSGCDMWCGQPAVDSGDWWKLRLAIQSQYFDACRVTEKIMRRQDVVLSTHLLLGVDE